MRVARGGGAGRVTVMARVEHGLGLWLRLGRGFGLRFSERTVVPLLLHCKLECRRGRALLMPAQLAPPIRASRDQL